MNQKKAHVAVIDDDESFARAIGRLLRASGYDVQTFISGEAFLAAAHVPRPDCLVLDIQLGDCMSGVEVQQHLRDHNDKYPIIFVTAHDAPEIRAQAERAGCIAYLRKPVLSHALIAAITAAIATKN